MLEGCAVGHPVCWRGILVQCACKVFLFSVLFSVLVQYTGLVAAVVLEGGAAAHPESCLVCWHCIIVQCVGIVFSFSGGIYVRRRLGVSPRRQ